MNGLAPRHSQPLPKDPSSATEAAFHQEHAVCAWDFADMMTAKPGGFSRSDLSRAAQHGCGSESHQAPIRHRVTTYRAMHRAAVRKQPDCF